MKIETKIHLDKFKPLIDDNMINYSTGDLINLLYSNVTQKSAERVITEILRRFHQKLGD